MILFVALCCIGTLAAQEKTEPAPAEAAPAPAEAAPAPAEAPPAIEPTAGAAPESTAPPAVEPTASPALAEAPPALARILDDPAAPRGWRVVDAAGNGLDSAALATALGDDKTLRKLRTERTMTFVQGGILIGVGLGLASAGVAEIVLAGEPVDVGVRPDPVQYQLWADWREEADLWELRLARADARDERIWIGATLLTGAVFAGALVPLTGRQAKARAEHPALMWDRATLEKRLTPQVALGPSAVRLTWTLE